MGNCVLGKSRDVRALLLPAGPDLKSFTQRMERISSRDKPSVVLTFEAISTAETLAATRMQATVRRYLAVLILARHTAAAIVIQRSVRGFLVRTQALHRERLLGYIA